MVLQRDMPLHIWGWSDPGETITVSLNSVTAHETSDPYGRWSVYLPPAPAGGPYRLTIAGSSTITLDDVLVGDVWFASGQSNMEMPLKGFPGAEIKNGPAEIAAANNPVIRLLLVTRKVSDHPLRDADGTWTVCTPETAANFSAAAYFFGRDLQKRENVPIGLIDSTWGGTPIEAWMSLDAISRDASLMPVFSARAKAIDNQADDELISDAEKRADEAAKAAGQPPPHHDWRPAPESWMPAGLFNAMVAPLVDFPIKGALWYQGEANASAERATLYERELTGLIADWRAHWQEGNFPFLYVQIANYGKNGSEWWPIVRDAERRALEVTNTAMAVTIDIGNPDNIHPSDKESVGERLALGARVLAYGENVEDSGPLFRQAVPEGGGMRVYFDHAEGLLARGGEPEGFEVAGEDGHFAAASAKIEGRGVLVSSQKVPRPKYVRYGWSNSPAVNLYNAAGLPACPFTSKEWL
jgi:sialate O-acetylesterase